MQNAAYIGSSLIVTRSFSFSKDFIAIIDDLRNSGDL
jgi:hypothetical protein